MAKELSNAELERMYDEMAALGLGQAALDCFRRHHGLPMPERPEPRLVIRPVPVSTPRRRQTRRKSSSAPTTPTSSASSKVQTFDSRIESRFDLKD